MFTRLENIADWFIFGLLNLEATNHRSHALHFFIYDSIKIIILLFVVINIMTFITYFFPIAKIRELLSQKKMYGFEHLLASLFGSITPFCTCSSVPLFIGFLRGGIPLGVTFSFLITSPLVNQVAVALFLGVFGVKITIIYVVSGIFLGTLGGWILGKFNLEKYLADFIKEHRKNISNGESNNKQKLDLKKIIKTVSQEARGITIKIIPYVLIGIAVGAAIHGFVPTGFFENYITKQNPLGVPIAVLFGIPMYVNVMAVTPIIQSLILKGIPLGTGLAFMMAAVGLSLPEFLILKKVMKIQLLLIFFGVVGLAIIVLGYFFNIVL